MKREKYSYYEFSVYQDMDCPEHWVYRIYDSYYKDEIIRESDEWFDSEQRARYAAIGHIGLLENGEG